MTEENIKVEVNEHVATVIMNRPNVRNAMTQQMVEEFSLRLSELAARDDLRVLVLTGQGTAFCSGSDLKARDKMTSGQTAHHRATVVRCYDQLENFPVPVIGKINGPAVAGGFEIALACDIRVAAESAFFAMTESRRTGAFAGGGGPVRLPRLVGKGVAKLVVFTGRRFSATEAFRLGFVEVVCADDKLDEETSSIVKDIVSSSPLGIRAAKQLINECTEMHIKGAMALSTALRNPLDQTSDYKEGISAWLEKRPTQFISK